MLVHNEENEDRDIKETFQSVFKPFWAGVPVVNDLLLHIKLLSDNFFITVKNVESVLKPTASPSLSWSLSQFPCFMKWLVVLLLPLGDGVLVHYKVTPMLWLSLIILIKLFQVTWHLHFFCFFFQLFFFLFKDAREQLLLDFVSFIYNENNPRRIDIAFGLLGSLVEGSLVPARYPNQNHSFHIHMSKKHFLNCLIFVLCNIAS